MRIFYAVDHQPFLGNDLWHNNFYLALVDLGHKVTSFEFDLGPYQNLDPYLEAHRAEVEARRPVLEEALLSQVRRAHRERKIDLFFSYFHDSFCRPEVIREIRSMGIRTANWFCNASYQFYLVQAIAPAYDFCLVPERFRLADYREIGANPIYCQEAANPRVYKPHPEPAEFDVTFVGARYGERPDYISVLLGSGIDVRVWGTRWRDEGGGMGAEGIGQRAERRARKRVLKGAYRRIQRILPFLPRLQLPWAPIPPEICGPPLSDEEMVKMFSRSRINLGFSACGDTHLTGQRILQVRLRDFEVPMSGGFYMVEHMDELEEFYEIGREIVCYRSKEDLVDKIRYYLAHDTEREAVRAAGLARCLRDHTWHKRLTDSFRQMELIT